MLPTELFLVNGHHNIPLELQPWEDRGQVPFSCHFRQVSETGTTTPVRQTTAQILRDLPWSKTRDYFNAALTASRTPGIAPRDLKDTQSPGVWRTMGWSPDQQHLRQCLIDEHSTTRKGCAQLPHRLWNRTDQHWAPQKCSLGCLLPGLTDPQPSQPLPYLISRDGKRALATGWEITIYSSQALISLVSAGQVVRPRAKHRGSRWPDIQAREWNCSFSPPTPFSPEPAKGCLPKILGLVLLGNPTSKALKMPCPPLGPTPTNQQQMQGGSYWG